jgi:hypothetical protein
LKASAETSNTKYARGERHKQATITRDREGEVAPQRFKLTCRPG